MNGGLYVKNISKWIIGFIISAAVMFISLGYFAASQIMFFKLRDVEIIKRRETRAKRLDMDEYEKLPKDNVKISSKFDYDITASFIYPNQTNKWMILCHGVSENKLSSTKYVNLFNDLGYNCVVFDARRHGETGGIDSTYGFYEKFDLETVIDYLLANYGEDIEFGVHGESMGAATTLLYAGELSNKAKFYISDASFATFSDQLTHVYQTYSRFASPIVLQLTYVFLKLRSKYNLYDVSPIKVVDKIEQPILFIHSKRDSFIPYQSSQQLYEQKKGPKVQWYPTRGNHVESFNRNPKQYRETVASFIKEYAGWEVQNSQKQ